MSKMTHASAASPFQRPKGLLGGYHADAPEVSLPGLVHFGEQWAPRNFQVVLHSHETWEFYLQMHGETIWEARGRTYHVCPGGFLAVPPHVIHRLADAPSVKHHFYFCAVDPMAGLAGEESLRSIWRTDDVILCEGGQNLLGPFQQLAREITLDQTFRALGIRFALAHLLIVASRVAAGPRTARELLPQHPAVAMALRLIDAQPERNWALSDLAAHANVSAAHLAERFRIEVGTSPKQYLLELRVACAVRELEESDLSVAEIAFNLGFSSSQHMAVIIKKRTGRSPSSFRKPLPDAL